jgi:hypothetical protein
MATTPTYSWPIPDDTDLVKDGAEAIRDLGNAIDTTVDGLGVGLVHIETQSASAVAAVNFNDVFSSSYDNYRLIFDIEGSTTNTVNLRFRAAGTDASGANYDFIFTSLTTTAAVSNNVNNTNIIIGSLRESHKSSYITDIFRPFFSEKTRIATNGTRTFNAVQGYIMNGEHQLTNSYDGFSLLASSGTFVSGSISLYGYAKA